eukprot:g5468.t1
MAQQTTRTMGAQVSAAQVSAARIVLRSKAVTWNDAATFLTSWVFGDESKENDSRQLSALHTFFLHSFRAECLRYIQMTGRAGAIVSDAGEGCVALREKTGVLLPPGVLLRVEMYRDVMGGPPAAAINALRGRFALHRRNKHELELRLTPARLDVPQSWRSPQLQDDPVQAPEGPDLPLFAGTGAQKAEGKEARVRAKKGLLRATRIRTPDAQAKPKAKRAKSPRCVQRCARTAVAPLLMGDPILPSSQITPHEHAPLRPAAAAPKTLARRKHWSDPPDDDRRAMRTRALQLVSTDDTEDVRCCIAAILEHEQERPPQGSCADTSVGADNVQLQLEPTKRIEATGRFQGHCAYIAFVQSARVALGGADMMHAVALLRSLAVALLALRCVQEADFVEYLEACAAGSAASTVSAPAFLLGHLNTNAVTDTTHYAQTLQLHALGLALGVRVMLVQQQNPNGDIGSACGAPPSTCPPLVVIANSRRQHVHAYVASGVGVPTAGHIDVQTLRVALEATLADLKRAKTGAALSADALAGIVARIRVIIA